MAKVPPLSRKGSPPEADSTVGNLDKPEPEEFSNLNFKVPRSFHREFGIFTLQHGFKTQTDLLYAAFEELKAKHKGQR